MCGRRSFHLLITRSLTKKNETHPQDLFPLPGKGDIPLDRDSIHDFVCLTTQHRTQRLYSCVAVGTSALYEKPHTTTQSAISSLFVDFGAKANQRGSNNNMTGGQMPTSLDYCLFIFFFLSRLSIILASNSISHLTLSRVYLTSLSRSR